jgi:hypothetical protein
MAVGGGPFPNNEGLVFGFDTGYPFTSFSIPPRFYPGEPTVNLLGNPSVNAYPTLGNSWGTYNTNQYGSGTYFSIGTVSSVSDNIVTMISNHSLRTFDVMSPQSTGGGVTGGGLYFIKKVSDTQFSLHAYNSSQDGSQGYINPATGYHKVHDSIAYDQRVSINSSGFPTMWYGPPHLPNSGLVKELITDGFRQGDGTLTDCMRQHITRDVSDHMAYGADGSITPNSPTYCSFWARAVDTAAVGKSINFYHYTYGVTSPTAYSTNATLGPVGEWRRFGYTFTSPNSAVISYWFNPGGPYKYDIASIQIEQNSHATPFTVSSRKTDQSLIDLTRNITIDVSDVSFNPDGQPTFDGTNDFIYASPYGTGANFNSLGNIGGTYSIEVVFKSTSVVNYRNIFDMNFGFYSPNTGNVGPRLEQNSNGAMNYIWSGNTSNNSIYNYDAQVAISPNVIYHSVFTLNNGSVVTYLNGTQATTASSPNGYPTTFGDPNIGRGFTLSPRFFAGNIYAFRVYNRALSATEVQQNYQTYKTRFGI